MIELEMVQWVVIFLAAGLAGGINAIAGGGTVFSFTALVWAGLPLIRANATNATFLIPGSLAGALAYRHEFANQGQALVLLLIPTVAGALVGAFTVSNTPEAIFRLVVPFLVLFATLVFAGRDQITRWVRRNQTEAVVPPAPGQNDKISMAGYGWGMVVQFLISFYGGYFGAGIGILMLASMTVMGMTQINRMNALKTVLAVATNGTAAIFFVLDGRVYWNVVLVAGVGALIGGYAFAYVARKLDPNVVRRAIVVAGVLVSGWMFWRL